MNTSFATRGRASSSSVRSFWRSSSASPPMCAAWSATSSSADADSQGPRALVSEGSDVLDAEPTSRDAPSHWLYSSGSTGRAEGLRSPATRYGRLLGAVREGRARHPPSDRCFSVAKLFFAYGLGNALFFPLSVGATSILWPGPPTPQHVYEVIEKHRPTLFYSCRRVTACCWRINAPTRRRISIRGIAELAGQVEEVDQRHAGQADRGDAARNAVAHRSVDGGPLDGGHRRGSVRAPKSTPMALEHGHTVMVAIGPTVVVGAREDLSHTTPGATARSDTSRVVDHRRAKVSGRRSGRRPHGPSRVLSGP